MTVRIALAIAAAATLVACSQEPAGDTEAAEASGPPAVEVQDGWVRATPGGNDVTAAYFTLANTGGADRLIGAASDQLNDVQLHASRQDDAGVMRMEPLDGVDVPAGGAATFAPGGNHLMLFGAADLTLGDTVCIELDFETADDRIACLPVMDDAPLP